MFLNILKQIKGDRVIWSVVVVLSLFSLLSVYSATRSLAWRMDRDASYYMMKQFGILGVGLAIMYVVHRINYTKFARLSTILFFISIPLLVYTLAFGTNLNEGSRWIRIPVINLTFQTSDLAKLALFVFLAKQLSTRQKVIKDWKKGFLPVLVPVLVICFLIMWANLSTALMLGAICCLLFYIGRVDVRHILALVSIGIIGVAMIFLVSKAIGKGRGSTWEKRIENFSGKGDADDNYQTNQAEIAVASGGFLGRGPGNSWTRDYLPHSYSDFIFAIIIEEYGLLGGTVVIMCYLLFLWRSILIFKRCPYAFGAFVALGLSFTLVFQALINMAVAVHLVPVTGLTLPLVSMGGSSIWFTSISIGIILSVSRYVSGMEGKKKNGADTGKSRITEADAGKKEIKTETNQLAGALA